ncbi:hypothetical protein SSP24_78330 [Streptomyces spinoverrucosus]|uniref:Uncharacterized protein n=1 Tax=Streptomyces spinoverrucosus TaxID=284043 RepID=A0A4Y3VV85_9ACTN|nr:hypothetical protein [Streptomyces spinoverrucosus]GEC10178.1 hypothetical protein SSP24_78330 [Streptomyces spinoverrucosus]GHB76522.1 hypothetical protein GCM10010397_53840 [Streptomyces spinoverrucosus]
MPSRPQSPQPPGTPRWVAMFYEPSSASWRVGAQSPYRVPVLYALGEMTQTLRARGEDPAVTLWGPKDGAWQRMDAPGAVEATPAAAPEPPTGTPAQPTKLAERMTDRRHQVLVAALNRAGLYDLAPDDETAVQAVVDQLDETTVRRVAHWLTLAAGEASPVR